MKVLSLTGGLHNILRYEKTNRSPDGEITSRIQKGGVINKKLVKREYEKPPDDDNAPVDKDEEEDVPKPSLDVDKLEQIHNRVNLHLPSKQLIQQDHPVEAHAAVRDGVHDAHVDGAQDANEFYHTVDDWPDGQAGKVRDDVHTGGHDDKDKGRLVEDEKPNGGSARPGKTPMLNKQNSPNQHNLKKSKTRSRRSIQPAIPDDPAHEAPTEGVHGGIPAVRGEGIHGDLKDAEQ